MYLFYSSVLYRIHSKKCCIILGAAKPRSRHRAWCFEVPCMCPMQEGYALDQSQTQAEKSRLEKHAKSHVDMRRLVNPFFAQKNLILRWNSLLFYLKKLLFIAGGYAWNYWISFWQNKKDFIEDSVESTFQKAMKFMSRSFKIIEKSIQIPTQINQKSFQNPFQIHQKSTQNQARNRFRFQGVSPMDFGRLRDRFWRRPGASRSPSRRYVGTQEASKSNQQLVQKSIRN